MSDGKVPCHVTAPDDATGEPLPDGETVAVSLTAGDQYLLWELADRALASLRDAARMYPIVYRDEYKRALARRTVALLERCLDRSWELSVNDLAQRHGVS